MTIYSLDVLLSQFGTSLLFHVQFWLLLLDLHTDFSGGRYGGLVFPSLEEFSTQIHTIKGFGMINKTEADVFLEFFCFFDDPKDVGNLISGSSAFPKYILNNWKFSVHVLLKPCSENFQHCFAGVWDECNCAVIWTFFGSTLLWDWDENWPFPVLRRYRRYYNDILLPIFKQL